MYAVAKSSVIDPNETISVCSLLEHPFAFATTLMVPPAFPTTVEIEFVVDVPVQLFGNVHVYELAPLTGVIE